MHTQVHTKVSLLFLVSDLDFLGFHLYRWKWEENPRKSFWEDKKKLQISVSHVQSSIKGLVRKVHMGFQIIGCLIKSDFGFLMHVELKAVMNVSGKIAWVTIRLPDKDLSPKRD